MNPTHSTDFTSPRIGITGIEGTYPAPGFNGLKDFLIFRVDTAGDDSPYHRELADESALEGEASNYADLMALYEGEAGIHYEVRSAGTGELLYTTVLYTTDTPESATRREPDALATKRTPETSETVGARNTRRTAKTRKEAPCRNSPNRLNSPSRPIQQSQLRMTIS